MILRVRYGRPFRPRASTPTPRTPLRACPRLLFAATVALTSAAWRPAAPQSAPAVRLGFTTQPPTSVQGGSRIRPGIQVALLDSAGAPVKASGDSVTLSLLSGPAGGAISGRTTVPILSGVATFDSVSLNLVTVGTPYKLLATTQISGVLSAPSSVVAVTVGPQSRLGFGPFGSQPSSTGKDAPMLQPVRIVVQDSGGNYVGGVNDWPVTIALDSNPSGATLAGNRPLTIRGSQATWDSLRINQVGDGYTLVISTSAPGVLPARSAPFRISPPGPPARLRMITPRALDRQVAGRPAAPVPVVVAVLDSAGVWLLQGVPGQIVLTVTSSSPREFRAGGTGTVTRGLARFSPTFNRAGQYRLVASFPNLRSDTSTQFTIAPGAPDKLKVVMQPQSTGVEQPVTPPVQVRFVDPGGAFVSNVTDSVYAKLLPRSGTSASLTGVTAVEAVNGLATFDNLRVGSPGEAYKIEFRSKSVVKKDTSLTFNVGPFGAVYKLRLLGAPTGAIAAGLITPPVRVVAVDSNGTVIRSFSESVALDMMGTVTDAAITGTKEADAADGVASFANATLKRSGTAFKLTAKAEGILGDTTPPFDVTPGPPYRLQFRTKPQSYVYGSEMAGTIEVEVQDAGGNLITTATDSIILSADPFFPVQAAGVRAVAGVATFSGIKVGNLTPGRMTQLVASSAVQPALQRGYSGNFTSLPGKAAQLKVASAPKRVNQGRKFDEPLRVEIHDASNFLVPSDNGTEVTVTLTDLSGATTLSGAIHKKAEGGIASFDDLMLSRLGKDYTLAVSSGTMQGDTTPAITVVGPAYKLVFLESPKDGIRNGRLAGKLQVQDSLGTPRNSGNVDVSLALMSPPGSRAVLVGTTKVSGRAASGSASTPTEALVADIRVTEDGRGFVLVAAAPRLGAAQSEPFSMEPHGTAYRLAFESAVPVSNPGKSMPFVDVKVLDSIGNLVAASSEPITVALDAGPVGATLNGTATVAASGGVARFTGLSLSAIGTGYVFRATAGALLAAKSRTFAVVDPASPCKLGFTQQPPPRTVAGSPIPVTVAVQRCDGASIAGATDTITLKLGADPTGAGPTLLGTRSMAASGTAVFTDVAMTRAAAGYTLVAQAAGLTPVTSQPFDVTAGVSKKLVVVDPPGNFTAGRPMSGSIRVFVADSNGNKVTNAVTGIVISLTTCSVKSTSTTFGLVMRGFTDQFAQPSGTCSPTKGPTVSVIQGEARFELANYAPRGAATEAKFLFSAGGAGALTPVESQSFTIKPGAAYTLGFEGLNAEDNRRANVPFNDVRVSVRDSLGNETGQGSQEIQIAIGSGTTGKLVGQLQKRAVNGEARFDGLSITQGGPSITLSASSPKLAIGSSRAFGVDFYGKPAGIAFKTQPSNVAPNSKMPSVQVVVVDDAGNVVDSAHVKIKLEIESNPSSAELRGGGQRDTDKGVAEFRDLRLNREGPSFSLKATAEGLPDVTSVTFDVAVPLPAQAPAKPGKGP